jgi:hypothetical protein
MEPIFVPASPPSLISYASATSRLQKISEIDLGPWKNIANWAAQVAALPGLKPPLELLPMADAEPLGDDA